MQHKSSWRHLDTCHTAITFAKPTWPASAGGLANPLVISQLSVGQVQVNFFFLGSRTAASSGFYDGFVHRFLGPGLEVAPLKRGDFHMCGLLVVFLVCLPVCPRLDVCVCVYCHCLFILHAFSRAFLRSVGHGVRKAGRKQSNANGFSALLLNMPSTLFWA